MTGVAKTLRTCLLAALALGPGLDAWALTVGRINLVDEGGRRVLKVATEGQAQPSLESLSDRMVLSIPEGSRPMATLKVGADPVKQIRFGKSGKDLRVVLDLSRPVTAKLGSIGPKGFSVDLGPMKGAEGAGAAASAGAATAAGATEAADEALDPALAGYTYSIVDIALGGDEDHSELIVSANGPASYKPSVRDNGRSIVLTFKNSSLSFAGDLARIKDNAIESVSAKASNKGGEAEVKLEVRLVKRLDYALKRDQNQILLRLNRPEAEVREAKRGDLEALVSVDVQNADLVGVIKTLADQAGFEYQFTRDMLAKTPPDSLVTVKVEDRPFREVLVSLLTPVSGRYIRQGNTLYLGSETEIVARLEKLPTISRTYTPKYLTVKQVTEILGIQFARDAAAKKRVEEGAVVDPREKTRLLLNGTQDEVSEWLGVLARFDVPESGEAALGDSAGGDGGSAQKTQVFRLQYLDGSHASLITAAIGQLYPEEETKPTPFIDTATRTLVVTTKLKYLRKIEKLLARLDVRPNQVNIEGRIVEVNQSVANQLGIDWSAAQQQASPNVNLAFDSQTATNFTSRITLATVQNGFNINARLQALINESKADLVSAPNITVNDNQQATITTQDSLVTLETVETRDNGVVTVRTQATSFNIPLSLVVRPTISMTDRRVNMAINFNLTVASGAAPAAGSPPPTSSQVATTQVSVNSGDTAVIGGLVRQNNLTTERKVPILGDIPLLGMLFRFDTESKDKKGVIIFITPSIVED